MLKEMNFILCILLLCLTIISNSSKVKKTVATDDKTLRTECTASFKVYDVDGDGVITKEDVEKFLKSPSSKYIPVAKDQFKKAILKAVEDCGGKMDFEQYFAYMKRKEKENPISKQDAVKAMFPGQTKVTKEQLNNKIPGLNKKYLQESYTIEEIVEIMNELEKEKEMEIKVKAMFPGQTKVTKVQLCEKIPGLDKKYELEESYTIEEIVKIMIELEKEEEEEGKSHRKEINVE